MKKIISIIIAILLPIIAMAQTQQGYVKTKGYVNKKGSRLPEAIVVVEGGNSAKCNKNGDFKLNGSRYYIKNVIKNGYVLTDPDQVNKTYNHSNSPLIFVMETPDEQLEQRLDDADKIRAILTNELNKKKQELEKLKNENKISKEKYLKLRQQLNEYQIKNEKLIEVMAERYSKIDYDQISDFDREFNQYILNGELTKADSLLNTKGDINSHINQYFELQEDIKEKEKNLEKEKELGLLAKEDLANRCEKKAEIFKIDYQNDSAAYYLERRASLDSANIEWLLEAGSYIGNYIVDYKKALAIYNQALHIANKSGDQEEYIAQIFNNIGNILIKQSKLNESLDYHQKALDIRLDIYKDILHPDVATSYNNIGYVLKVQGKYDDALKYAYKALDIRLQLYDSIHPDIATSYNNIGSSLANQGKYDEALTYYQKELNTFLKYYGELHPTVATAYNNIGNALNHKEIRDSALIYLQKALDIRLRIFGEIHPDVATSYNNIGYLYKAQRKYDDALKYAYKALDIRLQIYDSIHPDIATSYNNIGSSLANQGKYDEALTYYQKELEICLSYYNEAHPTVATAYNNIGNALNNKGLQDSALVYLQKALDIRLSIYPDSHPSIATSYNNIGYILKTQNKYNDALSHFKKSLEIYLQFYNDNHPNVQKVKQNIEFLKSKIAESQN